MYEGKPVGTPDAGAVSGACARRARREGAVHRAHRVARHQAAGPGRRRCSRAHDLSRLEALYLAGERCDPPTARWIAEKLGRPVVDHWWQTETGWPITAGFRGYGLFPFKPGSGGRAAPGYDVQALDESGADPAARHASAASRSACRMPPGAAPTLWQDDDGYRRAYLADFPGWYRTGDAGLARRGRRRLGDGPHRRHHQHRRPPALDRRDGGGARRASGCRRMRRDRPRRRAQGPGADGPRGAEGRRGRATRRTSRASSSRWSANASARSPRSRRRMSSRACRRRARARSCAPRSAASPTASRPTRRRPSTIPPCSTRSQQRLHA